MTAREALRDAFLRLMTAIEALRSGDVPLAERLLDDLAGDIFLELVDHSEEGSA